MKTKTVNHADGRHEIVRVLDNRDPTDNGPLSREAAIVWLEDIRNLPFVRQLLVRQCKSRRGKLDLPGDEQLIGYAKLIKGTAADPETGRYSRRVFYLRPEDRAAIREGNIPRENHVVDPVTILPSQPGKRPRAKQRPSADRPATTGSDDNPESLDDNVMQWLDDGTPQASPGSKSPLGGDLGSEGIGISNHPWLRETLGELTPSNGGEPIRLEQPKLTVGRLDDCDITLADSSISALHCELFVEGGYWFVRDQNSTNGVRVNGQRLEPESQQRRKRRSSFAISPKNSAPKANRHPIRAMRAHQPHRN
jgi:pSer/pThr/pTyr-binding forkhead associated (FHA) protein